MCKKVLKVVKKLFTTFYSGADKVSVYVVDNLLTDGGKSIVINVKNDNLEESSKNEN